MTDCVTADRQRVAARVNCGGLVDFATPSSVRTVINGIKTPLADNSPALKVAGLRSPAVQQGSNTDCAVEFEFRRPVMLAGIWLHGQVITSLQNFIDSRPSNMSDNYTVIRVHSSAVRNYLPSLHSCSLWEFGCWSFYVSMWLWCD